MENTNPQQNEQNMQHTVHQDNNITLTNMEMEDLYTAAKWSSFLGILTMVLATIFGISVLFLIFFNPFMALFYILGVLFYVFIGIYLLRFANGIKSVYKFGNRQSLPKAFAALKNFFAFNGIIAIIVLVIYILAIIGIIIGAFAFSSMFNGFGSM